MGVLRVVLCAKKEQKGQAREQVDRSGMNERGLLTTDRLGHAEQGLQGDEGGLDGQGGGPLVLEDVQADGPRLGGDVGVPVHADKERERGSGWRRKEKQRVRLNARGRHGT